MFEPPRCPNRRCPHHREPTARFYVRRGFYRALCRPHPIPRFQCKRCGIGFSRQTFRADYRDHKPHLNAELFVALNSGVGLRQFSRTHGLSRRCTELKFRKLARHLRRLNLNLRGPLPPGCRLQFDELETYETRRNTRPLSVPLLIERESRYVIWAEAAPIRPRGKMSKERKLAILEEERRFGPRKDLSRRSILRTLERGRKLVERHGTVLFESDEKSSYPVLLRKVFGRKPVVHMRTNSKLPRTCWNPLHPINSTEALARDLMGRLRRESWLVSKKRRYLDLALAVFAAYRNFVRRRFNHDRESPAQRAGFAERRWKWGELLSWRQDWAAASPHPTWCGARRQGSGTHPLAGGTG